MHKSVEHPPHKPTQQGNHMPASAKMRRGHGRSAPRHPNPPSPLQKCAKRKTRLEASLPGKCRPLPHGTNLGETYLQKATAPLPTRNPPVAPIVPRQQSYQKQPSNKGAERKARAKPAKRKTAHLRWEPLTTSSRNRSIKYKKKERQKSATLRLNTPESLKLTAYEN